MVLVKRYQVVTTGTPDIPPSLAGFCSTVSRAPDDSSFQVTVYGGKSADEDYDERVWVLSIPSFQWIVVDSYSTERTRSGGRSSHTCHIWDDSQMIVLGGRSSVGVQNCDTPPIRLLDTSTYTWKGEYKPNNVYSVPSVISAVIGGE